MKPPVAKAEGLLHQAHRNYDELRAVRARLQLQGVADHELPGQPVLQAFALLGDHERTQVLAQVRPHWQALVDRGVVRGQAQDLVTPHLRLLLAAQPAMANLATVQARLRAPAALPANPTQLRCANEVSGLRWGQRINLHFVASGVEYLLIEPSRELRHAPVLLNLGGGIHHRQLVLPGRAGQVVFSLVDGSGQVFRHTLVMRLNHDAWAEAA